MQPEGSRNCTVQEHSGVVEGGLGGAEPPLLKFHVDLGGLSPPPIIFARCIILNGNVL